MDINSEKYKKAIILKAVGGLYTVESPDGIFICKARGVFRNKGISPFAGDYVLVSENELIVDVLPRRNSIIRPPIANLDMLLFVVSMCKPSPNYQLLDKFIAISVFKEIVPIIVLTKVDLKSMEEIADIYKNTGIRIINIDYREKRPADELLALIKGKICAFTGNSGVGKSTLLNAIDEEYSASTADISEKLGRGRHTTRQVELFKLKSGGYIADTPGFSTFETNQYDIIHKELLAGCFAEFSVYSDKCCFKDCSHTKEKGCKVIEAVQSGEISRSRHNSYCVMYDEAKEIKDWKLK